MDSAALKLILDAFNRRFDKMEARLDWHFSPPPMTEPQDAVEALRDGAITCIPSVAVAPVCSSTFASTDQPCLGPAVDRANSADADDSVLVTARGKEFESRHGGYSDVLRIRPIGLSFEPYQSSTSVLAFRIDNSLTPADQIHDEKVLPSTGNEVVNTNPVAQQVAERTEQEKRATIVRGEGLSASGRVCIAVHLECRGLPLRHSVHTEQLLVANSIAAGQSELHATAIFYSLAAPPDPLLCHDNFAPDNPGLVRFVRLGHVGGYDGSLDDDPKPGVVHFDALLDQAVGRDGQAPAAAAALHADAVGATDGGLQAWVMAAGSAQPKCWTVCPAGDSSFAGVPIGALWEEEMLRWNDDNHGLFPVFYMVELGLCNISAYAELLGMAVSLGLTGNDLAGSVLVRRFYLSDDPGRISLNKEANATIPESFIFPANEPQGKATSAVVFVPIIDKFRGCDEVRRAFFDKAPVLATSSSASTLPAPKRCQRHCAVFPPTPPRTSSLSRRHSSSGTPSPSVHGPGRTTSLRPGVLGYARAHSVRSPRSDGVCSVASCGNPPCASLRTVGVRDDMDIAAASVEEREWPRWLLSASTPAPSTSQSSTCSTRHRLDAQQGPRCARITCCYMVEHRAKPGFCLGRVECSLCAMLLGGFVGFPGSEYPRAAFAEPAVPSSSTRRS
jgi:hypothetical protein